MMVQHRGSKAVTGPHGQNLAQTVVVFYMREAPCLRPQLRVTYVNGFVSTQDRGADGLLRKVGPHGLIPEGLYSFRAS